MWLVISIHTSPEGSDPGMLALDVAEAEFQSTLPLREVTRRGTPLSVAS